MPTYRCPVLIWRNAGGPYTGGLVEQHERAAVASTPREVLDQLRSLLEWQYREDPWRDPPDLKQPELHTLRVPVRPEYRDEINGRRYPVQQPFELRVHCVTGKQSGGPRLASLPMIGLRMNLSEHDDTNTMIPQMVQRWFEGQTPRQLSRYIAPEEVFLDDIFITLGIRHSTVRPRLPTERLAQVADPLGDSKVRSLYGRAWERDREVDEFARKLQTDRGNWLLMGDHGCGKTTLLCETVRHVERHLNEQEKASDESWAMKPMRRYWQTSAGRLISGMKYLGQWQERLEEIIHELNDIDGILCVESLLDLVRVGGGEATDSLASFCIPFLQRGELRMIAETSLPELDACRRLLPGLTDLFQLFTLTSLDSSRTIRLLDRVADSVTAPSRPVIEADTSSRTVQLFHRFQPYQALPGEVVAFWKELLDRTARSMHKSLTTDVVLQAFLQRTGLPDQFLRDDQPMSRERVIARFESEVIGQRNACEAAADIVIQFKAGMSDPRRPLGVLLFCGPTGVGKTELAKAVSRCLFGGEGGPELNPRPASESARMIRLDMSEYAGPWAADRLLMQPSGEPSDFLQQIRRQPFTVLLLDEIEKAHPSVYDVMMNVFDEGRLTDRFGRVTWFRSAVILLTSNLGAETSGQVGFSEATTAQQTRYESAVRGFFRPEFFNRLDGVITFNPLTHRSIVDITDKELRGIANREGLQKLGIRLTWTPEVVDYLARCGFDPRYGARPLQRTLETRVVAPLARFLVERPRTGQLHVHLRVNKGEIEIS